MDDPNPSGPLRDPLLPTGARTLRAAGVAGLIFAVLLTTSLLLLRGGPPSDGTSLSVWLAESSTRHTVALYLIPFAGIAFLWFMAAVRRRVGRSEDQFYSSVFTATGLLFTALLFASAGAASAVVALGTVAGLEPDASDVVLGRALAETLFYVFAMKMAGAFMLVTSTIGRRTAVVPRAFVAFGMGAGLIILVSVTFVEPFALIFPVWVAILSVILIRLRPEDWASS